jgi:hypothetical protein
VCCESAVQVIPQLSQPARVRTSRSRLNFCWLYTSLVFTRTCTQRNTTRQALVAVTEPHSTHTHLLLLVPLCRRDELQQLQELALAALQQQVARHHPGSQARARDGAQAQALLRRLWGVALQAEQPERGGDGEAGGWAGVGGALSEVVALGHVLRRLAPSSVRCTHHSTSVSTHATVSLSTGVACAARHTLGASTVPWGGTQPA